MFHYGVYDLETNTWTGDFFYSLEDAKNAANELVNEDSLIVVSLNNRENIIQSDLL